MSSSVRKLRKLRKFTLMVRGCNSEHKTQASVFFSPLHFVSALLKALKTVVMFF